MKRLFVTACLLVAGFLSVYAQETYKMKDVPVQTRWAAKVTVDNTLPEYPRPQLVREQWRNLNGLWDYVITGSALNTPALSGITSGKSTGAILVPYPVESALSGVQQTLLPDQLLWYRRSFVHHVIKQTRTLLHFGAVDYEAHVWINGKKAGEHTGGYTHFSFDITDLLKSGENEIIVRVYDPTNQGVGPHGKQVLNPQNIYYTPSSGIWQTVWLETVPVTHISAVELTSDIDNGNVQTKVVATGKMNVTVTVLDDKKIVNEFKGETNQTYNIAIPQPKLWSPEKPFLYDLVITLYKGNRKLDEVRSYVGMRKISVAKDDKGVDRIFLNNTPYFNLGTLDQGFWPDGLYTAPTDEALRFDIEAIKAMGFNTIRKHIKVEPARWYYHADKLGMLVWQDFVNPNQGLPEGSKPAFERDALETMKQLHNSPSLVLYTIFNEKWGQYDQQRITEWVKQTEPTRLVNGHSGEYLYVNEQLRSPSPNAYVSADLTDVHSYPNPMNALQMDGKARVLGEFGGIGTFIPDHQWITGSAWGYIQEKPASLEAKYRIMNQHLVLLEREGLSGSIYTQPFDVEGEQNGLMTYDREVVKIPFQRLREIHAPLNPQMGNVPDVAAINADITEPGLVYSRLLEQYINGEREAGFLRQLAMTAIQVGDKTGSKLAGESFITALQPPYNRKDLLYVLQTTGDLNSKGFSFIRDNAKVINEALGARQSENKQIGIIYTSLIHPAVSGNDPKPDWAALQNAVKPYGAPGQEIFLRAKAIFYLNHRDLVAFGEAADDYVKQWGVFINADDLNKWAWTVFEGSATPATLRQALGWSERSNPEQNNALFLDTQANLLYRLGEKEKAIALQEKAVSISGDGQLKNNLDKMKKGEPTWPQ